MIQSRESEDFSEGLKEGEALTRLEGVRGNIKRVFQPVKIECAKFLC